MSGCPKPTFLVIGAPKAGSTTLYELLRAHPDVFVPVLKEQHYFDSVDAPGPLHERPSFAAWAGEPAVGEATPHYLGVEHAAARIAEELPDARLVTVLRDPVARAYSEWWMYRSRSTEPLSFEDAIDRNLEELAGGEDVLTSGQQWVVAYRRTWKGPIVRRAYVQLGYYASHLERYLQLFPRESLCVLFADDLRETPSSVAERLYEHVGVDPARAPEWGGARTNEALSPIWRPVYRTAYALGFRRALARLPRSWVGFARRLSSRLASPPQISEDMRERLRAHFAPHDERLARILCVDRLPWQTSPGDVG